MLLIITNAADTHPNPVITKMHNMGLSVFRLNTDRLISDYWITFYLDSKGYHFGIKYKNYPYAISDETVTCVWERRPMKPITLPNEINNEDVENIILNEAKGFLLFLRRALTGLNLLWIGHPINDVLAQSKILQKMVAIQLGFKIPATLFSNQIKDLECFNKNQEIALKPIRSDSIEYDDGFIVFYTRKMPLEQLAGIGETNFSNTVNFIEEYTNKLYELRVTYVNGECFTAKVCSQDQKEEEGATDWRQGYEHGIKFEAIETPQEIIPFCQKYSEYFGLRFGCFDFIINEKGEYFFLECNCNGQWLWLEETAGLQISDALVRTFAQTYDKQAINRI